MMFIMLCLVSALLVVLIGVISSKSFRKIVGGLFNVGFWISFIFYVILIVTIPVILFSGWAWITKFLEAFRLANPYNFDLYIGAWVFLIILGIVLVATGAFRKK